MLHQLHNENIASYYICTHIYILKCTCTSSRVRSYVFIWISKIPNVFCYVDNPPPRGAAKGGSTGREKHTLATLCTARPCAAVAMLYRFLSQGKSALALSLLRCRPVFYYALHQQQQQQQRQFHITPNAFANLQFESQQKLWHSALSLLSATRALSLRFFFALSVVSSQQQRQ